MSASKGLSWRVLLRFASGLAGVVFCLCSLAGERPPQARLALWLGAVALCAAAFASRPRWRCPGPVAAWGLAVGSLLLLPRVLSVDQLPYTVTLDEILYPHWTLNLLGLADRHPWEVLSGAFRRYISHVSLMAQSWPAFFLPPLLGARLASVGWSIVSLWATFALGLRLFGCDAAFAALLFLGCSWWHVAYSRVAYPYMQPMAVVPLALWALVYGAQDRRRLAQLAGGALLGLSVLLYTPARIVLPVVLLWYLHGLVLRPRELRFTLAAAVPIAIGLGLCSSPYLSQYGLRAALLRYELVTTGPQRPLTQVLEAGIFTREAAAIAGERVRLAASVYVLPGGEMAVGDFARSALLDPVSAALAGAGLLLALVRWRQSGPFLLVVWVLSTFFAGQVATTVPRSAYRAAPVLPALALCAGLAVGCLIAAAGRGAVVLRVALAAALVPAAGWFNLRYLRDYEARFTSDALTMIGRAVGASDPGATYYLVGEGPMAHRDVLRFLASGRRLRDVPSLMDVLGSAIDTGTNAVFVLQPGFTGAQWAIRRCYPSAAERRVQAPWGADPPVVLAVSAAAVEAGVGCRPPSDGPGLKARYIAERNGSSEVILERHEDWPLRWSAAGDSERFSAVEWSGALYVPVAGAYQFLLRETAARGTAKIGDVVALDGQQTGAVDLASGDYSFTVRCAPERPPGSCTLRWRPPGGEFRFIPVQLLRPNPPPDR